MFLDAALAIEHALHRAQALSPAVLTIWDRKGDLVETVDYSAPKKTGVNKLKLSLRSRLEGEAEDLADR